MIHVYVEGIVLNDKRSMCILSHRLPSELYSPHSSFRSELFFLSFLIIGFMLGLWSRSSWFKWPQVTSCKYYNQLHLYKRLSVCSWSLLIWYQE